MHLFPAVWCFSCPIYIFFVWTVYYKSSCSWSLILSSTQSKQVPSDIEIVLQKFKWLESGHRQLSFILMQWHLKDFVNIILKIRLGKRFYKNIGFIFLIKAGGF